MDGENWCTEGGGIIDLQPEIDSNEELYKLYKMV